MKNTSPSNTIVTKITNTVATVIAKAKALANTRLNSKAKAVVRAEEQAITKAWMGARVVDKIDKIDIPSFTLYKVDFDAMMPTGIKRLLGVIGAMKKDDAEAIRAGMAAFANLEKMISNMNKAFAVKANQCRMEVGKRSLATDIAGVVYGRLTDRIVVVDHDIYNHICAKITLGGLKSWQAEKRLDAVRKRIFDNLVRNGITITFADGKVLAYDAWAATSSQQKIGAIYMGEHNMMIRTAEARAYGVKKVSKDTGAEYLKRQALLFTPSVPAVRADGSIVTLADIIMMPGIKVIRKVARALYIANGLEDMDIDPNLGYKVVYDFPWSKKMFDGQMISDLPSAQMRGLGIKGFNVHGLNELVEFVANKLNLPVPAKLKDIDGIKRELNLQHSVLMTKDCWKGSKLGVTWDEFVKGAKRIAKDIPNYDALRIVRYSDSAEESKRTLTRQSIQQFMFASTEELNSLVKPSVVRLVQMKKLSGMLVEFGGLMKDPDDRTAMEELFLRAPGLLASAQMTQDIKTRFDDVLADAAAGRVTVHGQYPYIAMDPVAMIQILVFGMDANDEENLGLLEEEEINAPNLKEGQKIYGVRYPNNHLCGQILTNRNFDIYKVVGDVAVLSYKGFVIDRFDGDFDGDEMSIIEDAFVVEMMERTLSQVKTPLILFPHEEAAPSDQDMTEQIVTALFNGQKFNRVGVYSNLATKIMKYAGLAQSPAARSRCLVDAAFANVGTILVIDMIKTGTMPKCIDDRLDELRKIYKAMPWNQRFCKHNKQNRWDDETWDTEPEDDNYVCDMVARLVVNGAGQFTFDTEGVAFDPSILLNQNDIWNKPIHKGTLNSDWLNRLHLANFGAEDSAILRKAQAGDRIGAKDLVEFYWHNYAALCRKMSADGDDKEAAQRRAYLAMVRQHLINLPDTDTFARMTADQRRIAVVNAFIRDAFELNKTGNGIDQRSKGSYAKFVLSVFAEDILANVEENTGVPVEERRASRVPVEEDAPFGAPEYEELPFDPDNLYIPPMDDDFVADIDSFFQLPVA